MFVDYLGCFTLLMVEGNGLLELWQLFLFCYMLDVRVSVCFPRSIRIKIVLYFLRLYVAALPVKLVPLKFTLDDHYICGRH